MSGDRRRTPRQEAWTRSARFREIGLAALRKMAAGSAVAPRCAAAARSTGLQCGNRAMENGKCRLHGGRTPKGDHWHRPRWPDASSPDAMEKLHRKLQNLERAATKRRQRLRAMTPEARAVYDAWSLTHKPGSAVGRAQARSERQQTAEARRLFQAPRSEGPIDPELAHLERLITECRRRLADCKERVAAAEANLAEGQQKTDECPLGETGTGAADGARADDQGVFG